MGQVLEAVTREQHRLGMDLHDGLGQELTPLSFLLTSSARVPVDADVSTIESQLLRCADVARHCLTTARAIAHRLSPIDAEPGGFERALTRLVESTIDVARIDVTLRLREFGRGKDVDPRMAEPLFRIVQEALANAIKHGNASKVDISVVRGKVRLEVVVTDNGEGFTGNATDSGYGLRIMQHRAHAIGGRLEVARPSGGGMVVRCICPVSRGRARQMG